MQCLDMCALKRLGSGLIVAWDAEVELAPFDIWYSVLTIPLKK